MLDALEGQQILNDSSRYICMLTMMEAFILKSDLQLIVRYFIFVHDTQQKSSLVWVSHMNSTDETQIHCFGTNLIHILNTH